MYKGRDDIQTLVSSLSKGEKRHFSKLYNRSDEAENAHVYLQLFEQLTLGKSQPYKITLNAESRTLTAAKRRLYDNVLRSLRLLHESMSVDTILQNRFSDIEILYSRGLPEQGLVLLKKAYQLAAEHEKFGLLLQALDWEKRINIVLDQPTRPVDAIRLEEREVIAKLDQVAKLEGIYSHIMLFKKQHGFVQGALRENLEQETVRSAEMPRLMDCKSNKAIYYYNLIFSIYYWMVFDHQRGFDHSKELLIQKTGSILPNDYFNGILQHITSSVCLTKFDDTLNGIQLGNAFLAKHRLDQSVTFRSLMFAYQATYRTVSYQYLGDKEKLIETIRETEVQLQQFESFLPLDMRKIVVGNLMNAYMAIGNLDQADLIWNTLFDKRFRTVRQDIHADLYLFRLFSLLHSKTYSLLPSAALSAYRHFKYTEDAKNKYVVELPVAKLLQKERDYENREVLEGVVSAIRIHVEDFISGLKGKLSFQEHYSRYAIWCDAIVQDEPFYMAAARWYAGYQKGQGKKKH